MNIDKLVNDILVKHHNLPLYVNTNIYNFILNVFKSYKGNQNDLNRIYNLIMSSNDNFGKIINENHKSTSIVNESCTSFMLSHIILSRLELLSDFQNCKYDILFFTVIDYLLKTYYITEIPKVLQSKDNEIQILWKILNAAFYYSRDYLKTLNLDCSFSLYTYFDTLDLVDEVTYNKKCNKNEYVMSCSFTF